MNDLISRKAAINALWEVRQRLDEIMDKFLAANMMASSALTEAERNRVENDLYIIESLPSAQPERKKGEWIYYQKASGSVTSTAVYLYPVCSECGCEHPIANFCPNCGADMTGGKHE